ncbi:hypothetical protein [Roseibacillus persicicus]|uniref:Uncharacterized protein n=1 Tax=Roseibacillus persicicus TaxID=454148 RepID=A0A918TH40_9BACT|nr:hypothetical protein [Roseibacillus persicicus]MDQ8192395.1 hypothetical protein [Roseibacillus persicicus]GHC41390.1 hypothetical protein GCM10007100_02670 [Roseibacillus persicicus]
MKTLFTISCLLAVPSLSFAADFEVQLVQITSNADLPRSIPQDVKPFANQHAASLCFLIKGENLVSIDDDTLTLDGEIKWEAGSFNKVSDDGRYARLDITTSEELIGKLDALKFKGTIEAYTAADTETTTLTLSYGGEAKEAGPFEVAFSKPKKTAFGFGGGAGIKLSKGDLNHLKSITVKVDGKEANGNGWFGSNNSRTYNFENLGEGEVEVTIVTWKNMKKVTIPIEK